MKTKPYLVKRFTRTVKKRIHIRTSPTDEGTCRVSQISRFRKSGSPGSPGSPGSLCQLWTLSALLGASLFLAGPLGAATWMGAEDAAWDNPNNWLNGIVPSSGVDANIEVTGNDPVIGAGTEASCSTIRIDANSRVDLSGGQLTVIMSSLQDVSFLVGYKKIVAMGGSENVHIMASGSNLLLTAGPGEGRAHSPAPANLAWGVPSGGTPQLSWTAGAGAVSHNIYFSTNAAEVTSGAAGAFQGNQTRTTFNTSVLAPGTAYYWRVDEVTATTVNAGPIWSFRTNNNARYTVSEEELEGYFSDPPNEFRIVKYQLNNANLQEVPPYGFGGYQGFFYNNLYLNGPNNGPDAIGPLVDAAIAQGRTVWGADDNGYPSGSAGGMVVENNPEYEVRGVAMLSARGSGAVPVSIATPPDCEKMVSAVLYPVSGGVPDFSQGEVQSVQDTGVSTTGLIGEWKLCAFVLQIRDSNTAAQGTAEQFGSTGHYSDLLNSKAVASWISLVHEPIIAEISDPGAQFEGFYVNEPALMQLNWDTVAPYACLPWNDALFDVFQAMHGYALAPVMAALYQGDDLSSQRIRMHFHQAVGELLRTSFTGQIADWCGRRDIVNSGHPLIEKSLAMQVPNYGDMIKVFSASQVPAIDLPMPEPNKMASQNYHFPKMMSSMGSWNEYDRRVIGLLDPIINGYGLTRLTPSEDVLCNTVNRAALSGVNLFATYIPHNQYESTEVLEQVNAYTGRISAMLTGARIESSVALYYPIEMFQMEHKPTTARHWGLWNPPRQVAWDNLQETMLSADLNYNIVHPEWVRDAVIENGELKIGSGSYRYLVMPDVELISEDVLDTVQQFEAAGGTVLWVDGKPQAGAYPEEDSQVTGAVAAYSTVTPAQLPQRIANPYHEDFSLELSSATALTTRFNRQSRALYFTVNPTGSPITVLLEDPAAAAVKIHDPVTGSITVQELPTNLVIDKYRSVLLTTLPVLELEIPVPDGSFEDPPGTHGTWRVCHTSWNPSNTDSQFQLLQPNGTHFDAAADGDWCALLSNIVTINQNFGVDVNEGDTLSVTFFAGRSKDTSGTAGGGVFDVTFKVGATPYSMRIDTTGLEPGTWQSHTHTVTVSNSGLLSLEVANLSGHPWIDDIGSITIVRVPPPPPPPPVVVDPSFERAKTASGTGYPLTAAGEGVGGVLSPWVRVAGRGQGTQWNTSETFSGGAADGDIWMYSNNAGTISQTLAATLQPETFYTLTVAVGRPNWVSWAPPGFGIEFWVGGVKLASEYDTNHGGTDSVFERRLALNR